MDNVIVVLIDSVFSKCLTDSNLSEKSMPFVTELIKKGIFAPNVYSFGPYTDAATKGLFSGKPTLSDYGYYYGVNSSDDNHFKIFKENGYETYGFYYPYYLISGKHEKNIDHSIYTSGFLYISVWNGKFKYYSEIQKDRQLSDIEYQVIIKCMEMVFDCWMRFYDNISKQQYSDIIVNSLYDAGSGTGFAGLMHEYKKFLSDKKGYMNSVLKEGMNHPLAKINDYNTGLNINEVFVKEIYRHFSSFFRKLNKTNFRRNLHNNRLSYIKAKTRIKSFFRTRDVNDLRYFVNYFMLLFSPQISQRRCCKNRTPNGNWQNLCSLNKEVETLVEVLKLRESKDKPFYGFLHCLEPHHDISFFSYDSNDLDLISEEIQYIRPIVDNCSADFKGNLVYYLSLRYVDLCIKRLFQMLQDEGIMNNTTFMFLADHGTSYANYNIRHNLTNTFHRENYNIPVIIYNERMKNPIACTSLYDSSDIFPTLFDLLNLKSGNGFNGKSMIKDIDGRRYIITEFMGPGCPDMIQREVWISIRDKDYVVAYKNPINQPLNKEKPVYIYILDSDSNEVINYCNDTDVLNNSHVKELIDILNNRFIDIQTESSYLNQHLDELNVL